MAKDAKDPLSRYFEAAMGLTELTRKRAERIVRSVVKQGEAAGNPKELVEHLLERSTENREALVTIVRGETKRAMKAMGLATQNDVERLEQQLRSLRRQVAEAEAPSGSDDRAEQTPARSTKAKKKASKKPAKKASKEASKKPAKKATKKATKKTATRKKSSG